MRSVETAAYPGVNQNVGDEVPNRFNGCNCLSKLRNVDFFVQYLTMMWQGPDQGHNGVVVVDSAHIGKRGDPQELDIDGKPELYPKGLKSHLISR